MRTPAPAFSQPRAARLSPLAGALALALAPAANGYVVTNNLDDPATPPVGSLRWAIQQANSDCAGTPSPTISFSGPFTISPSTQLPTLVCPIGPYSPTIDAFTYGATLSGPASDADCGLTYAQAGYGGTFTVKGMTVKNFAYGANAGGICGPSLVLLGNTLQNNSIGVRIPSGGPASTIGGPGSSDRNIIVGNSNAGIFASSDTTIENNWIGTANGTTKSANGTGIYVGISASHTITDNLISGNNDAGIYIDGGFTTISGNTIGLNEAETGPLGNGGGGIYAEDTSSLTISNNTIGGNSVAGIYLDDAAPFISGNTIGGANFPNTVGILAFCSGYFSIENNDVSKNQSHGIALESSGGILVSDNTIADNGGSGVRITSGLDCSNSGTNNEVTDNTITGNKQHGVQLVSSGPFSPVFNRIYRGSITANGVKNISLGGTGTTALPNDTDDGDFGANHQQNWPEIVSVVQSGGNTVINFLLPSAGFTFANYTIQAYANSAMGKPGGEEWIGETGICGDCGDYGGTIVVPGLYDNISLTATLDGDNETSEFSPMAAALTAPAVTISPKTVSFGSVEVDSESASKTVVLRSIGDQPWVIDNIFSDGDGCYGGPICSGGAFACSTTCETDTSYAKNQTCTVTAKFTPFFAGTQSTTIGFCDNTSSGFNSITLTGTGVPPPPLRLTPNTWDFGGVPVGETSRARDFTLSNTNDYGGDILIDIQTVGEFDVEEDTCGATIGPGETCNIAVTFGPTTPGESSGELRVLYEEEIAAFSAVATKGSVLAAVIAKGPTYVKADLTGVGLAGGDLALPDGVNVGAAVFGGSPISTLVTLTNNGLQPANISSITIAGPFTLVNNCPAVLEAGQSCTLTVSFTAPGVGPFTGTLTVVSDSGSAEIPVTATGQVALSALLRIEPAAMGFGSRVIGSLSSPQTVVITNIGGAPASLSLASSAIDFLISANGCGASLLPNTSCTAQMGFRPLGFGSRLGTLVVTSNAPGSPQAVNLSGTGCRPFTTTGARGGDFDNCAP